MPAAEPEPVVIDTMCENVIIRGVTVADAPGRSGDPARSTPTTDPRLCWGHSALTLVVAVPADAPPGLIWIDDTDSATPGPVEVPLRPQPLAEVLVAGHGRAWSGSRSVGTAVAGRLRYAGHTTDRDGAWQRLRIDATDPETGLRVEVCFRSMDGVPAVQTWTRIRNEHSEPVVLHAVSSFVASAFSGAGDSVDDVELHWARNCWLAENRWQAAPVRATDLPDLDLPGHGYRSRGCFAVSNTGTWSTKQALPVGVLVHRPTGRSWAWQIEHNGSWRWEIGECREGVYLSAAGPSDTDHQWRHVLEPGGTFASVPVGLALSGDGLAGAAAALTRYRRLLVRPHPDHSALPVVFNDYMNTLMGDPTSEALLPLIEAAAAAGAEYFCIDACWHDDTRSAGEWPQVLGAWEPSTTRFTGGLTEVIKRIRVAGMVPGLWLEPEVVGVRSPVARDLPDAAFFQRDGRRQVEDGRYHLDLRHPAAVAHLDRVIDRLVSEFGVGYFKFDYNVDFGSGTDLAAAAPGGGLLDHNRAHLAWLDRVLDRHPGLVIENCGSGALRMDYAMLARLQVQSTSDQQNPLRYPPIAAAAPLAVLPEQAGSWAYPQPGMSPEEIAFCMVTGMTGRLILSGHLDQMAAEELELVSAGVAAYRTFRTHVAEAVPVFPAGLPGWTDPWIALGLRPATDADRPTYLAVWRRPGASPELSLLLPHLAGCAVRPVLVYPTTLAPWDLAWSPERGVLTVTSDGAAPTARIIAVIPDRGYRSSA